MKRTIIMLLVLGALTACNNKPNKPNKPNDPNNPEEPKEEVNLDPYAKLYISSQSTKVDENGLETAEYIVRNCAFIGSKKLTEYSNGRSDLGSQEHTYNLFRDFVNNRFVFEGTYAVLEDGKPGLFFRLENTVFTIAKFDGVRTFPRDITTLDDLQQDTVAYIPNSVMDEIRAGITKSIKDGDYEECHRILNEAFIFIPIKDGAEWRRLETDKR